jgi:non-specific serine/threonine protein kinase
LQAVLLPSRFTHDADRLRRFEKEARAASALNHPNIITIYEIGAMDGTRFIATEFIEGETLREHIGRARLSPEQILDIGCQAASALAAAHAAGIVHHDIKPANIMLRRDGYVKVLDFGLAKLTSAVPQLDVTDAGRVMGTINYMSPEQAMGKPLDQRTDIFSLAVVLYELATGRRLFEGQSEAAVYDAILHAPPPALREFAPAAPMELDTVLRRAMEKDPARRYASAADFRADLRLLQQRNTAIRRFGVVRRFWRAHASSARPHRMRYCFRASEATI